MHAPGVTAGENGRQGKANVAREYAAIWDRRIVALERLLAARRELSELDREVERLLKAEAEEEAKREARREARRTRRRRPRAAAGASE